MDDTSSKTRGKALIVFLVIVFAVYFAYSNKASLTSFVTEQGDLSFLDDFEESFSGMVEDETETIDRGDEDNDQLVNVIERILGSDPQSWDTDGDGFSDYEEFINGYDPVNSEIKLTDEMIQSRYQQFLRDNSDPDQQALQLLHLKRYEGLFERSRINEAAESFQSAMSINPDEDYYADFLYDLNDAEADQQALEIAKDFVRDFPDLAQAYFYRGYAYQNNNRLDDALKDYLQSVALDTDDPFVFNNLGAIMDQRGDYQKAVEYFQKALDMDPDEPLFQENLKKSKEMISGVG